MWRRRARFVTARAAVFLCLASESLSQQPPEVFGLEFQWPVLCRETPLDALDLLGNDRGNHSRTSSKNFHAVA